MRKSLVLLILCVFVGLSSVWAQTKTISGTITGADDGLPIPGAAVMVKGTSVGTVTNMDGVYSLEVPANATTFVVSYMGMVTQEVAIQGRTSVSVVLASDSKQVQEVVVTALGIKRSEKSLGYSATTVGSEEITKSQSENAMNALAGKVAGMVVTSSGGGPGASTKVILRGYSSINGNNNALYVVDGVVIDNSARTGSTSGLDFGNRANDINPNDIASMTVLKGAAATALYGSRAANGVIMITTKSGQKKDKLNIEYNGSVTFTNPLRIPQSQNVFGQGWSGLFAYDENGSWGPRMDGTERLWGNIYNNSQQLKPFAAVEDNIRDFYDTGKTYNNAISISGGTEKSTFYMSYSNIYSDGFIPTNVDKNMRHTITAKGEVTGKVLKASAVVNYVRKDGSMNPDGLGGSNSAANLFSELLQIPRDMSIVDFKDYQNNPFNTLDYYFTPYAFNPYYAIAENRSNFYEDRVYGNVTLEAKLAKWANLIYRVGADVSAFNRQDREAIMSFAPGSPQFLKKVQTNPGSVYEEKSQDQQVNHDFLLDINKELTDELTLNGLLGYSINKINYSRLTGSIASLVIPGYYNLSNTSGTPKTATYRQEKRMMGVYGQVELGWRDMLFANFTARNDWSSTLPLGENTFFYPAVNVSFIPTELIDSEVLTYMKVRASWGKSGSDADPYSVYSVFVPAEVSIPFANIYFPIANVQAFEKSNQIGNLKLKPVISTEYEIGADFRLFKGRIYGDVAYYKKLSDGQIFASPIAPSSGYQSQVINFGEVENKGIEALIGVQPIKTKDWMWDLSVNYTRNRNKVLSLPGTDEIRLTGAYGVDFSAIKGEPLGVFKAPDYVYTKNGEIVVGATGLPLGSTNPTVIGNAQHKFVMGINNRITYKNIDFSFTFDIRQGGYMYSGTADLHYFVGNATNSLYNDREPFVIPNSVKENPDYDKTDPNSQQYLENDQAISKNDLNSYYYHSANPVANRTRVISRSFVKLRDVSLSYTLPKAWAQKVSVEGLQLTVSGRNLLMWTPEDNNFVDPEGTSYGNDLRGDFGEFRTGPTARYMSVGLKVNF